MKLLVFAILNHYKLCITSPRSYFSDCKNTVVYQAVTATIRLDKEIRMVAKIGRLMHKSKNVTIKLT